MPYPSDASDEFTEYLAMVLDASEGEHLGVINNITAFRDGGMLTNNDGFTVRCEDGHEYQVTVVQSK